ncbi:MAG TPA: universal stress protein [Syntrophales bacterium]|nr:universal stress protein [Syntrophales bacterium]
MKNRFIVLIDFSAYSKHLIQFAYDWSQRANAEILLVHHVVALYPVMTPYEVKIKLTGDATRKARERLKKLIKVVLPGGTAVRSIVSDSNLIVIIKQLLGEPYNNLLLLGIKGTGLLKKIFIGSQAVEIINHINNLIVAIPENAACCAPDVIHVAVQRDYPLHIYEFNKFLGFHAEKSSRLVFFSVMMPGDDQYSIEQYLKELTELYMDKFNVSHELYLGKKALKSLREVILKKQNEFIVVQRGSRMLLTDVFRKFLINELVYEGNTPLVIVP